MIERKNREEVLLDIEALRENLHKLILKYGLKSKEVLNCSEELDELIYHLKNNELYKKTSARKN